ncbi:MAG: hypothetical protein EXS42_07235 [Lacunisphaera sp.]|nr:hypothetical protein [Lacunisphaera sp.]
MTNRPRLFLLILVCSLLTGCVTTDTTTAGTKTEEKDEYVEYTPTGSHIPIRVKQSSTQPTKTEKDKLERAMSNIQATPAKIQGN